MDRRFDTLDANHQDLMLAVADVVTRVNDHMDERLTAWSNSSPSKTASTESKSCSPSSSVATSSPASVSNCTENTKAVAHLRAAPLSHRNRIGGPSVGFSFPAQLAVARFAPRADSSRSIASQATCCPRS